MARREHADMIGRSARRPGRDHAAAVAVLTSVGGEALSYAQLEERGVPRPAIVCYELAAAGWPIQRGVSRDANGAAHLGVRMSGVPALEPDALSRAGRRGPATGFRRLRGALARQ